MDYKNENVNQLFEVISRLNTAEDVEAFLEDLCTIKEIQDMTQRFCTAVLLEEKESYQAISEKVGTSSATICRVNHCLNYGSGGYKKAIACIKEKK